MNRWESRKGRSGLQSELEQLRRRVAELEAAAVKDNKIAANLLIHRQTEDALRESEGRYRSFVQNFQGIAYRGKLDFTPIFFHGAVEKITGYTAEDFYLGNPRWNQLIHPEDLARMGDTIENMRQQPGYATEREYRIIRRDGQVRWIHELVQNICDSSGKPAFIQGALYDITERKQAEAELQRRTAQLEALRKVSLGITAELKLEALLDTVTTQAMNLFGGDTASLFLYRADQDALVRAVGVGVHSFLIKDSIKSGEGLVGRIWEANKPSIVDDYSRWEDRVDDGFPPVAVMGAPIRWRNTPLGVLSVISNQIGNFSQTDAELLELFATQAAIAIVNARLYAQAERMAVLDDVTGLTNRRGLIYQGHREIERATRFGRSLSALFLDIDRFKEINDRYAHQVGDRVLRVVADCCQASVREVDLVARYGGEEFVILLAETDLQAACEIAERLRRTIEAHHVPMEQGELSVTVSIGVAQFTPEITDLETLIHRADEALYAAKQAGRNRVRASRMNRYDPGGK